MEAMSRERTKASGRGNAPVFAALADPMRRDLLMHLAEHSPKTATQLAEDYPITRQGILKHLRILEEAGLVAVRQKGREKQYTLTPGQLGELERWIRDVTARWDERLLRLKAMLEDGDEPPGAPEPA
ncbi:MAG: winged helix-turn-helix transcriptional regulator [Anaerolineae bacterium]|nr:winged helix-turn-helix transcriptional regulator [Anaerolineae bacterium]